MGKRWPKYMGKGWRKYMGMHKGWPKLMGKSWPKCMGKGWPKYMDKGWPKQLRKGWPKCMGKGWPKSMGKGNTIQYSFIVLDREVATTFWCFHCIVPSSLVSWAIVLISTFHIIPNHIAHGFLLYHMCTTNMQHQTTVIAHDVILRAMHTCVIHLLSEFLLSLCNP